MASKTVKFDVRGIKIIQNGLLRPSTRSKVFFSLLGTMIDQDTQNIFETQGAGGGKRAIPKSWPPLKRSTLQMPSGRFRIAYGTDEEGTPGNQGKFRPNARRYSFNSTLLQVSGQFRQSFKITKLTANRVKYQSVHKLAGKIGAKPERQVLQVTTKDKSRYGNLLRRFTNKEIKF